MKAGIYMLFILTLQFLCGGLVMKLEWDITAKFLFIILPISMSQVMLFTLYDYEIKNNEQKN